MVDLLIWCETATEVAAISGTVKTWSIVLCQQIMKGLPQVPLSAGVLT
jgi:hypothetical protein